MSVHLLDVNVLLALGLLHHPHHSAAKRWFLLEGKSWATCPFTEAGFLRIASNRKITPSAAPLQQVAEILRALKGIAKHHFWAADFSILDDAVATGLQGHNQITDAYLLALAQRRKGQLATFDVAIKTLAREAGDEKRVLLIPTD